MTTRLTALRTARGRGRGALSVLAVVVVSVLVGCGASGLASFAGLDIARRDALATWTPALSQKRRDPGAGARALSVARVDAVRAGQFTLLTYNVAGLPQLLSPSTPRINIPLMSPLLNGYDVALVQEDFAYHRELTLGAQHPYRSSPTRSRSFVGDGLSQFSWIEFATVHRVRWDRCHGYVSSSTDCLADKGFSFSELRLAPGVVLHLYNLHADAGQSTRDIQTRVHNFAQLTEYVRQHSTGHAVIVAGDTNLRTEQPGDAETLQRFLAAMGLRDACRTSRCPEEEPIDRVLWRSSSELTLSTLRWWEDRRFVDAHGEPLSDHPAIGVEMHWRRVDAQPLVAHVGTL